jgi:hypothetical protein
MPCNKALLDLLDELKEEPRPPRRMNVLRGVRRPDQVCEWPCPLWRGCSRRLFA